MIEHFRGELQLCSLPATQFASGVFVEQVPSLSFRQLELRLDFERLVEKLQRSGIRRFLVHADVADCNTLPCQGLPEDVYIVKAMKTATI